MAWSWWSSSWYFVRKQWQERLTSQETTSSVSTQVWEDLSMSLVPPWEDVGTQVIVIGKVDELMINMMSRSKEQSAAHRRFWLSWPSCSRSQWWLRWWSSWWHGRWSRWSMSSRRSRSKSVAHCAKPRQTCRRIWGLHNALKLHNYHHYQQQQQHAPS